MADDRILLPLPDAGRTPSIAEPTQDASDLSGEAPLHPARPFRDSPLAATIVRVALAIEERECKAAVKRLGEDLPGAHDSRGANEHGDFLNLPSHTRNDER